jgi:hypothetical protein
MLLVLVVLLHDSVGLPVQVREAFKEEVALLMREAGITIQITDCAIGRTELNRKACMGPTGRGRVRVILSPGRHEKRPDALGTSLFHQGQPVSASVYVSRVREAAAEAAWNEADLMAHAAAHEIAHLVLGPDSHETGGIMRSSWPARRLIRTPHKELSFGSSQAHELQQALAPQ